jgi:hypothetical protein
MNYLADISIAPSGGFHGIGPLGNPQGNGVSALSNFISVVIGILTIIAFIWFTFILVSGAISIISSGGDKQALETAKKKITNGIIGLVLVITAVFIIDIIGNIFGINFLNILQLFKNVTGSTSLNVLSLPANI